MSGLGLNGRTDGRTDGRPKEDPRGARVVKREGLVTCLPTLARRGSNASWMAGTVRRTALEVAAVSCEGRVGAVRR